MKAARVGLIAGAGSLPIEFLKKAREKGVKTVVFTIMGEENRQAEKYAEKVYPLKLTALSKLIVYAKKEKISSILMLGHVRHENLIRNISFDLRTIKILLKAKDRRAGSVISGVINELKTEGIRIMPTTFLLEHMLAGRGAMTRVKPSAAALKDIRLGFELAAKLASLDIGQTVIIKKGSVIAAEALEGTDRCIKRGAKLAGHGFIAAKAARPDQDMRFDVPVVGLRTVRLLKKYRGAGIAVEAGRTFLLNKDELIKYADKNRIFIYGM